jgi:hypothetical protein
MASLDIKGRGKLKPKFCGLFKILERVGDVAYKQELQAGAKLHDVFHVGLLKPFRGEPPSLSGTLPPIHHECACLKPLAVTKSRVARNKLKVLVQWRNTAVADASWVTLEEFRSLYHAFQRGRADSPGRGGEMSSGASHTSGVRNRIMPNQRTRRVQNRGIVRHRQRHQ